MTNTNLLEIAKGKGNAPFLSWFRQRLGESWLDLAQPIFQAGAVSKVLDVSSRFYQTWEGIEDFPVREPMRAGSAKTDPRLYTRQDLVNVAYWHWLRKVAEDVTVMTVKDVAERLNLEPVKVIQMMRDGLMPGTGQSITRDEFTTWLLGKIGAE